MRIKLKYILLSAAVLTLASCAEEKVETEKELQEKILDAYIQANCPSAQKLTSGLTILDLNPGDSKKPGTNDGIYIHYNTYDLSGTCFLCCSGSTEEGCRNELRELLQKLGKGGRVTAIIPPWLTSSGQNSSNYVNKGQQSSVNILYELKAGIVIDDVEKYQIDSLEKYIAKHFSPKIDSTAYGYYFRNFTHPSGIPAADTVVSGTEVNVWYVGRLLDGYVFDTNIADTARKYRIYDSSNEYEPLSVTMRGTFGEMTTYGSSATSSDNTIGVGGESSLIFGFVRAVKSMTYADQATALFMSGLGYGSNGNMSSGKGVPEYAMLRFDLWLGHPSDDKFPPTRKK